MSSIATLAHTAGPAFNVDLYAAAAAIIPTLFVAIAVQHGAVQDILTSAVRAALEAKKSGSNPRRGTGALLLFAWTAVAAAYLVLCAGLIGEAAAIGGLSHHDDSSLPQFVVVASVFVLTVGVAIVPAARLSKALWSIVRPTSSQVGSEQAGRSQPQPPRAQRETGETAPA